MWAGKCFRGVVWTLASMAVVGGSVFVQAQTPALKQTPAELVRETVNNEVNANNGGARFMFRDRKEMAHGSQTKLVVETTEATAGMLIAIDDKPLTAEQSRGEEDRLNALAKNPEELKKKQKAEKEDARRTTRIVNALPDAFLFEVDGTEPATAGVGNPGGQLVRLKFRPNPGYSPPSHTEQVLTGMQGYLLLDAQKHRIARIDGTLFKEVGFGWGILGHLDKGGRFLVEQGDVGNNHWEITHMSLSFTGKELFFKAINIKIDEVLNDFRPAPNLSFAEAVEFLKRQSNQLAENHAEKDRAKVDRK